ncbi:MAG TPA: hypothetical protein VFZ61_20330 [Polyangiales bacterium]
MLVLCALCLACDSLSDFGGEFKGPVVEGSFVRNCFGAKVTAKLRFSPSHAVGSTRDLDDDQRNWLTLYDDQDGVKTPVFDAPLEPIYAITADSLADFDFPGQKRQRNYLLMARSTLGPLAGVDSTVVVSLLATKKIELRVIARAAEDDPNCVAETEPDMDAPRHPEYYGLFKLSK